MRSSAFAIPAVLLLAACSKEDLLRHEFNGVYTISSVRMEHFTGGSPDSSRTIDHFGSIGLYDNDINPYNNAVFALAQLPASWSHTGVAGPLGDRPVGWYTDEVDGGTLTFFTVLDLITPYAIYTVEKQGGKEYTWTYVETDAGGMSYKETWTVERR